MAETDAFICVFKYLFRLQAFSNLTMTTRRELCRAMVFATIEKADMIVMSDGEELDSWSVILNGHVEVIRRDGRIEQLQLGDRQVAIRATHSTMLLTVSR